MGVDLSKQPHFSAEQSEVLQQALRATGFDVRATISGQFLHIEGIETSIDAKNIANVLRSVQDIRDVIAERRESDYRVIAEANVFSYVDPHFSDQAARDNARWRRLPQQR